VLVDLKIEDFNPVKHVKYIYDWMKLRGMSLKLIDELPEIGTIAIYKELGIAAAFLRKVEPNFALIDNLITNPEALAHLRHEAIDECIKSVIEKAKKLKIEKLFAYTIEPTVLERSVKYGFEKLPHTLIGVSL
jgi:hypothetical protein